MTPFLSGPLSIEALTQFKALEPLSDSARETLHRIQSRNVSRFNETTVREEIISPLLQVLGYDIQSYFSIDREKRIQLLGNNRYLDYNLTLWSKSFWLIEVKRPKAPGEDFTVGDVSQALSYAVHPEINAALVVLCDGRTISVFDREEDQQAPVLTLNIANLVDHIDQLRYILEPWQIWFFEKRRIVRHLDKVFDKQFNMGRLDEFKRLVIQRLDSKRQTIVNNMRMMLADDSHSDKATDQLRNSSAPDLIEGAFVLDYSIRDTSVIAETLVNECRNDSFSVIHRIFPDHARDMNDAFCMHALNCLLHLHKESVPVSWLPSWLGGGKCLESAIKRFLAHCLTHFRCDPARRNILLSATALRRLFKATIAVYEQAWSIGQVRHLLQRYAAPEDTWMQIVSSPQRHNLLRLDGLTNYALRQLVSGYSDDHGRPQSRTIEAQLREIWLAELAILENVSHYQELLKERGLEEIHPTEMTDVVYDYLGHSILCVTDSHAVWRDYIMEHHLQDVEILAQFGSWQARKWLGRELHDAFHRPPDQTTADRFFLGDTATYRRIREAYGYA